ncbi:MAG: PIN domain-containing protein [Spirochaetes bacterium]|nr:PIN domain-containing protein [Spirochaetota bacterium]
MIFLLDTDTIIYWLNGNQDIEKKVTSVGIENLAFSIISKAELYFGAYNSDYTEKNISSIKTLSGKLTIVSFDDKAAMQFGIIKSTLRKQGLPLLDADIFIASIAIANGLTLVTNNERHYSRIQNIEIENWIKKEDHT